ncbi:hypothetical protein EK21DRAFT_96053 [Setomelanomma holmii]|uniref:Uncharacterized protein n=1 Tax=Setomelanomma holmii TaxID=210430 RepID=A0A9P4LSY3_9PLEO|nr:hypothetical protein EK21DRAFT_96053 [Setomelanomma holmii]
MATSCYPYLDWRESTPGHWGREIDEAERFYTDMAKTYEGSGRIFFAITGFVSLSIDVTQDSSLEETGKMVEDALRQAWLRLRFEHPTIASYVEYNLGRGKWVRSYRAFLPDGFEAQIDEWLSATSISINPGTSGLQWCNLDPPAPKFPSLFIVTPPSLGEDANTVRRDLVIRSPHDTMDGMGTLQLLNALLSHASLAFQIPEAWRPPPPNIECQLLSPPLRIAAAIPPILTIQRQHRLQAIINRKTSLRNDVEILSLPSKKGPMVPGKHQRIAHELSVPDTARLIGACRKLGATITHVYHTAVACSMQDLQERSQESRLTRYLSYALINERPRCMTPYNTPAHAAAVYHSVSGESLVLGLAIPSATEDTQSTLVEQVRTFYTKVRNDPDHLALVPSFFTDPISAPNETPVPPPNDSPSVSMSSFRVLDKIVQPRHGPFKIDKPWVTGEELGRGWACF